MSTLIWWSQPAFDRHVLPSFGLWALNCRACGRRAVFSLQYYASTAENREAGRPCRPGVVCGFSEAVGPDARPAPMGDEVAPLVASASLPLAACARADGAGWPRASGATRPRRAARGARAAPLSLIHACKSWKTHQT